MPKGKVVIYDRNTILIHDTDDKIIGEYLAAVEVQAPCDCFKLLMDLKRQYEVKITSEQLLRLSEILCDVIDPIYELKVVVVTIGGPISFTLNGSKEKMDAINDRIDECIKGKTELHDYADMYVDFGLVCACSRTMTKLSR